jgi:hypothetical protein
MEPNNGTTPYTVDQTNSSDQVGWNQKMEPLQPGNRMKWFDLGGSKNGTTPSRDQVGWVSHRLDPETKLDGTKNGTTPYRLDGTTKWNHSIMVYHRMTM